MPRRRPFRLIAGIALTLFLVSVASVLGGVAYTYRTRFYPGVSVAGIDLTGLSQAQAQAALTIKVKHYLDHPIKIAVPDITRPVAGSPNQYADLLLPTTAGQLGMTFADQEALAAAWQVGHEHSWSGWFKEALPHLMTGYQRSLSYYIDPKGVRDFVDTQVVPKIGQPVPATIAVSGGTITVAAAHPGFSVDKNRLATELSQAVENAPDDDTTYLRAPVAQADSPVTPEVVRPVAERLDALGNIKVTLTAPNLSLVPDRSELLSWFLPVQDEQGEISLSVQQDTVEKYLSGSSQLDQDKSLATLVQKLTALASVNPMPTALAVPLTDKPQADATIPTSGYTLGKFSGKYVEVNLAQQRLYLINGANLEKSYLVSSGKWSTPTPVGTYTIHSKSPLAYSSLYGLYMPYWENFLNGAYGIHELPYWPNGYREGANHLGVPVSDGCIRLGIGAAKEVYDWTEIGTPVYIH